MFQITSTMELLQIADLYLRDWQHRNEMYWKQMYACFSIAFFVIVFPYTNLLGQRMNFIPCWLFHMAGFMMSVLFVLLSYSNADRLTAVGEKYRALLSELPDTYRYIQLSEIRPKGLFNKNGKMAYVLPIIMFILLNGINCVIFLLYYIRI